VRRNKMELVIFLKNGNTLKFEDVTELKRDYNYINIITFNYVSVSNHKKKNAMFFSNHIAGMSFSEKEGFDVNSLLKA
jgi:hypothetical protein